jgi:hypothetical protein
MAIRQRPDLVARHKPGQGHRDLSDKLRTAIVCSCPVVQGAVLLSLIVCVLAGDAVASASDGSMCIGGVRNYQPCQSHAGDSQRSCGCGYQVGNCRSHLCMEPIRHDGSDMSGDFTRHIPFIHIHRWGSGPPAAERLAGSASHASSPAMRCRGARAGTSCSGWLGRCRAVRRRTACAVPDRGGTAGAKAGSVHRPAAGCPGACPRPDPDLPCRWRPLIYHHFPVLLASAAAAPCGMAAAS